ncbi:MAG TPA: hypothetical protein VNV42_10380 [Solirubrobacteraceae bacterium]|nr:hypothetical protein [Solirubrobacteraceae bacterium]
MQYGEPLNQAARRSSAPDVADVLFFTEREIMRARAIALACLGAIACMSIAAPNAEATKKGELVNESGGVVKGAVKGVAKSVSLEGLGKSEFKLSCVEGALEGEVTSTRGGKGKITFKGCEAPGKAPGACTTVTLPLIWGYVVVGTEDVWKKTVEPETTIVCGTAEVEVKGAFLSHVKPQEELTKEFLLNSKEPFESKEETLEINVNGKGFEKARLPLELKVTLAEKAKFV